MIVISEREQPGDDPQGAEREAQRPHLWWDGQRQRRVDAGGEDGAPAGDEDGDGDGDREVGGAFWGGGGKD